MTQLPDSTPPFDDDIGDDQSSSLPDRMIFHGDENLIFLDEGEGEPFDLCPSDETEDDDADMSDGTAA